MGMSNPLELELQIGESHPPWILGTELRSSAGAVHTVNPEPSLQLPHPTSSFVAGSLTGAL